MTRTKHKDASSLDTFTGVHTFCTLCRCILFIYPIYCIAFQQTQTHSHILRRVLVVSHANYVQCNKDTDSMWLNCCDVCRFRFNKSQENLCESDDRILMQLHRKPITNPTANNVTITHWMNKLFGSVRFDLFQRSI